MKIALFLFTIIAFLTACSDLITGQACLCKGGDTLVEHMREQCKAGDAIVTKNTVYFYNLNDSNAYNDCIYVMYIYSEK